MLDDCWWVIGTAVDVQRNVVPFHVRSICLYNIQFDLFSRELNQSITEYEFFHWFTWWMQLRILLLISSKTILLTLPISVLLGLIKRNFGFDWKFSLWSFRVMYELRCAIMSILLCIYIYKLQRTSKVCHYSLFHLKRIFIISTRVELEKRVFHWFSLNFEFFQFPRMLIFIIYRPGARGIRRNAPRSDDISQGL